MKRTIWIASFSFVAMFLLGGCAFLQRNAEIESQTLSDEEKLAVKERTFPHMSQGKEQPELVLKKISQNEQKIFQLNLTPLTKVEDIDEQEKCGGSWFSNSYTRLLITSKGIGNGKDNRKYDNRNSVLRFLWGTKYELNLSAHVKIDGYEATVPILSLTHQGDKEGEQWVTNISHDVRNFPLFLVKGNGLQAIPHIDTILRATKGVTSNIAVPALQVAVAGLQQVSPEARILTTLTTPASREKAQAIDNIIGKLFNKGIQEQHSDDRDFKRWSPNGGWKVSLNIPKSENDWNEDLQSVGDWTISFAYPQPSIFSDWRVCGEDDLKTRCMETRERALEKVYEEVEWNQVLSYEIARTENRPMKLSEYILQKDYYHAALTNFDGQVESDKITADNLCRAMSSDIVGLGLNSEDAKIVVWAVINGMQRPKQLHIGAYDNAPTCKEAVDSVVGEEI